MLVAKLKRILLASKKMLFLAADISVVLKHLKVVYIYIIVSPLPNIYAVPYTPNSIEIKWEITPALDDDLYTYTLAYWKNKTVYVRDQLFIWWNLTSDKDYFVKVTITRNIYILNFLRSS